MCNTTAVPFVVKDLSVSPNPILFGHNLDLTLSLQVDKDIGTSNTLQVKMLDHHRPRLICYTSALSVSWMCFPYDIQERY